MSIWWKRQTSKESALFSLSGVMIGLFAVVVLVAMLLKSFVLTDREDEQGLGVAAPTPQQAVPVSATDPDAKYLVLFNEHRQELDDLRDTIMADAHIGALGNDRIGRWNHTGRGWTLNLTPAPDGLDTVLKDNRLTRERYDSYLAKLKSVGSFCVTSRNNDPTNSLEVRVCMYLAPGLRPDRATIDFLYSTAEPFMRVKCVKDALRTIRSANVARQLDGNWFLAGTN